MYNDRLLFQAETVNILDGEYEVMMQDHSCLSAQRQAMGLSQQTVAKAAGVDLRKYQRLESGERSMCSTSLRVGLAICDVLGLDPHRFVPLLPQVQDATEEEVQVVRTERKVTSTMKKFKVFRSLGKIDESIRKHELVAVEYGKDIYEVTDKLIRAVNDDAEGMPQFEKGYTAATMTPEEVPSYRHVKRYQYVMQAILQPEFGSENELLEYGIIVEEMSELGEREQMQDRR